MQQRPGFVRAAAVAGAWMRVAGLWVRVRVTGPHGAPAVLLLHHFHGNVDTWRHLHALMPQHRVVSFDRPGFGYTERPDRSAWREGNPYTREAAARIAIGLLNRLDIAAATLVGSSAGGTIALEIAARTPSRARGIALISPAITGDAGAPPPLRPVMRAPFLRRAGALVADRVGRRVGHARVGRSWHDPARVTDEDVAVYRTPMGERGWASAMWEAMVAEPPPDLRSLLRRIEIPAVVLGGISDPLVPPGLNERTARAIPGADFVTLEDVGHTPHEERPDLTAEALLAFLSRFDAGRQRHEPTR